MRKLFPSLLWLLALLPLAARAQTMPPPPPANLQGQPLRDWLRQNWYDPYRQVLSYATARGKMYNFADNYNNTVTCVYSGYTEAVPYSTTNTSAGVVTRINCEHTVPQSWFNQTVRMRSDMHHLFPTYDTWNNLRGSDPYAEIPDPTTTTWMRGTQSLTTIPTTLIDEYSEDTNTQFEPREDHKGNLARAVFYFYTMHGGQPELAATGHANINSVADINTLYQWHLADPVDAHEIERNRRVAVSQGNFNPYIAMPQLVATAWGLAPPGPTFSFASSSGSIVEGNSGTSTYTATISVSPAPTAPLTVQVALDAASSTATAGSDFSFSSPQTLTFAAGQTSATVTVTVTGDTQPEADETVVLSLQSPGTGGSLASPVSHTLTITNDDGTPPTLAFASATGSIIEGNAGTSTYSVQVQLSSANASVTYPFTVPVTVEASSTASSTADYTLNTSTLTFTSAQPQTITVTVNGDLVPEPNETVRLRLGAPVGSGGVVVGTANTHVLTITNDDQAPVASNCSAAFFSEYIEGSATNTKALEIFNPTPGPLNLSGLRVELFANGATTPTSTQALTGTIAPGDVYVIVNTGVVDMGVAAQGDVQSNVAFFNGDDVVVLFDGTDTLDIIGVVGQRPTSFTVPGGSTLNNTLVRLPGVGRGTARWNSPDGSATWQALGADVFTNIGRHSSTACVVSGTRPGSTALRGALEIYPNPAAETVRLRLPGVESAQSATVEVLDNLGRVLRSRPATLSATDALSLDLRGLPAGLYAVRVRTAGADYTGRVQVQ